jgi:hypothetical protein
MSGACLGNQPGQILLHVPALAEKQGNDPDRAGSRSRERCKRFAERRPHQLEISHSDEKVFRKLRGDALERARPFRVARAVGEQDDPFFQCSVARRPS